MNRIKTILSRYGFYPFLLIFFFSLHHYNQYYGLVRMNTIIIAFGKLILGFTFLILFVLIFTKNYYKSFSIGAILGFIYLFYGDIRDFIKHTLHLDFLSQYSVLIIIVLLAIFISINAIIRKKDFRKFNFFLNSLLIASITWECVKIIQTKSEISNDYVVNNERSGPGKVYKEKTNPDVYYLVFDCYPGSSFLKTYLNHDNSEFDSLLSNKGFYIVKDPQSNYNRTAFSIASTLNFSYLKNVNPDLKIGPKDYNISLFSIKNASVVKIFDNLGYDFYNLSIFDIAKTRSIQKETFLTLPEENVLLYNTFLECIKRDLLWHLAIGKYRIKAVQDIYKRHENKVVNALKEKQKFNYTIYDSLQKIALFKKGKSKYVYAHFYLPHPPFFYDENGKANSPDYIFSKDGMRDKTLFLNYLVYTNEVIMKTVEKILYASDGKAIIILQSDHGFTDYTGGPIDKQLDFKNFSAFYFPNRNYSGLYDSMSNINTFPFLFNKLFDTNIKLKADSTFYLSY